MGLENTFTVLIVDDIEDNVLVLKGILEREFDIQTAGTGERALEIVQSATPPDIVLLDVMMPGINGYEVCRILKSDDATAFIPVVMITALSEKSDRFKALEAGADDFLTKPVDLIEVLVRVRSLLRVKSLHDALQKSYLDLKRLEELRENLTDMIVHDMRTPLTGVIGALDLLYDLAGVEGNADAEEFHEMALQSSHKLLQMINDLLDITKMESGEMKLSLATVNVNEVALEVETSVKALAQVENLTFTLDMPNELPPLSADREILRRVLVNLAGNAIKFTPAGGTVRLTALPSQDGFVTLAVIDTGPGIPPGYEEKIFEKFGQVDEGMRQKFSTGLGLTFCKMGVEMHGGKIWVESEPGQGSTFALTWPISG